MLEGEHAAGSAYPGLYLVEDEERARGVADLAQAREVAVAGNIDAALALDGLDDHRRDVVGDCAAHRVEVVVGDDLRGRHDPLEGFAVFFLTDHAQGAERAAVKRVGGGDEVRSAGRAMRELQRALHGFGAGVHNERTRERGGA